MKSIFLIALLMLSRMVYADGLPVFSIQTTNQIATPGSTITLTALARGATSYQWRFNGVNISSATNAMLQIKNAQTTNSGYYVAVAMNSTGWVPGQLAYLSIVGINGTVPLSNLTNANWYAGQVISQETSQRINGSAQVAAGPALDQMQLITGPFYNAVVTNGLYNLTQLVYVGNPPVPYLTNGNVPIPSVVPGQTLYYTVYVTYTNNSITYTQQSTVMRMSAGGGDFPVPSAFGLQFPNWPEWPEPVLFSSPATTQLRVPGESVSFENKYYALDNFGLPTIHWRKDGNNIPGATNFYYNVGSEIAQTEFTITNLRPSDAGVYDAEYFGDEWEVGPKIYLSVQTTNGPGVFQNPHLSGPNFISNLIGAATRNYEVQWSTNLLTWNDLITLSNATGTITFTNSSASAGAQFYRTLLLP